MRQIHSIIRMFAFNKRHEVSPLFFVNFIITSDEVSSSLLKDLKKGLA